MANLTQPMLAEFLCAGLGADYPANQLTEVQIYVTGESADPARPIAKPSVRQPAGHGKLTTLCVLPEQGMAFETKRLSREPDVIAPDGSDVRVLLATSRGGMAHFELAAGHASLAIRHRTVDEIWFVLSGSGEMWRNSEGRDEIVALTPGVCVSIPVGTHFQFRAIGAPLSAVGVTMPPWPGPHEAVPVPGKWPSQTR